MKICLLPLHGHPFCLSFLHLDAGVRLDPAQHCPRRDGNCHPGVWLEKYISKIFKQTVESKLVLLPKALVSSLMLHYAPRSCGLRWHWSSFLGTRVLLCPGALQAGALQGVRQNMQFVFVNDLPSLKIWGTMLTSACMSSAPCKKSTPSRESTAIRKKKFPVSDCLHVANTW